MLEDLLSRVFVNQWAVFLMVSLVLLALGEAGFRFGAAARLRDRELAEGHSGAVQGAVLGMLGLLLGFSFAMAVQRLDNRRSLTVEEANAIGTTWLRTDFLKEPMRNEAREMLRRYVGIRLEVDHLDEGDDYSRLVAESSRIQNRLWEIARIAAAEKPDDITATFVETVNDTIDLQASRIAARRNHVPGAVWLLLLVVAGCGAWSSGYASGASGHRSAFSEVVFPVLIGVVITLVSDLDRPRRGLIGISQQPMRDLLESMNP
jgi:hypothetical protein